MSINTRSFSELYRKVEITTRARYNAARRLDRHQRLSQWMLTLISVELIAIPLFQTANIPTRVTPQVMNVIEIFLSVLILAYSLLIGAENYATRSEKMLNCGIELSRLGRQIAPLHDTEYHEQVYLELVNKYHDVLEKYENHLSIDHEMYKIRQRTSYASQSQFYLAWITARVRYILNFWHYITVFIGIGISLWYILFY